MIGMLNASQKRTNRAPFTDASMSKQPAADAQYISHHHRQQQQPIPRNLWHDGFYKE